MAVFALQVSELLHQLRELIATFVSSFDSSQEQRSAEAEFAPVLDALVDPAVQMCSSAAALLSDKRYRVQLELDQRRHRLP